METQKHIVERYEYDEEQDQLYAIEVGTHKRFFVNRQSNPEFYDRQVALLTAKSGEERAESRESREPTIEELREAMRKEEEATADWFSDNDPGETIGVLEVRSMNTWIKRACDLPDPVQLWHELWYEGELCVLFADTNLGKTILALQIAESIAHTYPKVKVLYIDCEMSDKQQQLRCTDQDTGLRHRFPRNLMRSQIAPGASAAGECLIESIELAAQSGDIGVVIVDNLTYLCLQSEQGEAAGELMTRLSEIKRRNGLSILVLSHTPKRDLAMPITQNDLKGSKNIMNFADSAFAIGQSSQGDDLRYIKQIKQRNTGLIYGSENVLVCRIVKQDGVLRFEPEGTASERAHLKQRRGGTDTSQRDQLIVEMSGQGKSLREISKAVGLSHVAVLKIIRRGTAEVA